MRIETWSYGILLIIVPLLLYYLHWVWLQQSKSWKIWGDPKVWRSGLPTSSSLIKQYALIISGLALILSSMLNPQIGFEKQKIKGGNSSTYIILDLSKSMLAQDMPPNRLERSKRFAKELIEALQGSKLGLIYFAGGAFVQVPLTYDGTAIVSQLAAASPDLMEDQGTAIADALQKAESGLSKSTSTIKSVVLITDGEDHEEGSISACKKLADQGITIFPIGVGTDQGGRIPTKIGFQTDYKRDEYGKQITTKLNRQLMQDMAEAGKGTAFHIDQSQEAINAISKLNSNNSHKGDEEVVTYSSYKSYFQIPLGLGLLLVFIGIIFQNKKQ